LDDLDQKIIAMLREDASRSLTKIAKQLGVPEPTLYFRVNRLKRNGTIRYTVKVQGDANEKLHAALLTPKSFLLSEMTKRVPERIGEALAAEPEVVFAAKTEDNKIVVVWRGSNFHPSRIEGVVKTEERGVSVYKSP
jgi:DNA-binding Lrp family transcriptional regulator